MDLPLDDSPADWRTSLKYVTLLSGVTWGSAHPWYISSLPPRSKNRFRFGSVKLMMLLSASRARGRSAARLNRCQSHLGSLKTTYLNGSIAFRNGSGPASLAHPSSEPGSRSAGEKSRPVDGSLMGAYMPRAVSTCAGVRHEGPSPVLHSRTPGSKRHRVGSAINPSVTPSSASHAVSAAR